jgi:FKBP-type peptidyl-prolyl cis-trans isomerase
MIETRTVAGMLLAAACALTACAGGKGDKPLKTENDKVSYAIGWDIAQSLKRQQITVNVDLLAQAIRQSQEDRTPQMTEQEMMETMMSFGQRHNEERRQAAAKKAETNRKAGAEFMEKNKTAAGVKTTASGLQYKVVKAGAGARPKATDTVTVNYRGTLIDGTEFDSSYKRGEPVSFPLNQVIPGWTEGLQLMPVGSTYEFYIPADLAYGDRDGGPIPPGSTLIFTVELLSIGKK